MESGEHEMAQIKRESEYDALEEVSDRSRVKDEPCQIGVFSECGKCDGFRSDEEFKDHINVFVKYEDQEDENYSAIELNTENADVKDMSTTRCNAEQLKSEDDIDIHYNDAKTEIDEKKPGEYGLNEVCNKFVDSGTNVFMKYTSDHVSNSSSIRGAGGFQEMTLLEKILGKREKPFQCEIFPKAFTKSAILKVHERVHTGEKPFNCKVCSKAFTQMGSLKIHERVHIGEKPFHCENCSKTFRNLDNLKIHEKIHIGNRSFQCNICSRAFTQRSNLKRHERIHAGKKTFHSKISSKSFFESSDLKHQKIHTGGK